MKKIIISVNNDLVSDQRVDKVANTLINKNYRVVMIGRKTKNSLEINRKYQTKRFKLIFNKGTLFYANINIRIFIFLFFNKFDILLSNDLDTLLPNYIISKIKNKPLVYDSHELYTEVPELVHRNFKRKIWEKIEKFILPKIKNSYTVCDSIAEFYKNKYKIDMKVIRNVPIYSNSNINIKKTTEKQIILYQGAVNLGRGIEYMILAMRNINNTEFWIVGDGDITKKLKILVDSNSLNEKVKFFGKIPFEKLKQITVQADLGVSIEENLGLNYYYALPNKLFDYINSNIPVLVSDFPEMSKIVNKYLIGDYIQKHDVEHIEKKIIQIFSDKQKLEFWKKNTEIAKKELIWQNEEKILLSIFNNLEK